MQKETAAIVYLALCKAMSLTVWECKTDAWTTLFSIREKFVSDCHKRNIMVVTAASREPSTQGAS